MRELRRRFSTSTYYILHSLCSTRSFMPSSKTAPTVKSGSSPQSPLLSLWTAYYDTTSTRLKTIDAFLVFLMLSGIIQFLYCVLITNFPFNAFLAGYVARMA